MSALNRSNYPMQYILQSTYNVLIIVEILHQDYKAVFLYCW